MKFGELTIFYRGELWCQFSRSVSLIVVNLTKKKGGGGRKDMQGKKGKFGLAVQHLFHFYYCDSEGVRQPSVQYSTVNPHYNGLIRGTGCLLLPMSAITE
jgi:hypothetical protein